MSATPTTTLTLMRGDTVRYNFRITETTSEAALDITGFSAWFTVKKNRQAADTAKVLQKTYLAGVGTGIEIIDALNGQLRLTLTATDIAALDPRQLYVWDLQVKTAAGDVFTADYATGPLAIEGDVTRAVT
jgi:hypothetical protein